VSDDIILPTPIFIRPPGTIVREGLMFYCSLFFFIARSPRSVSRSLRNFATSSEACSIYKCRSKKGAYPKKILGAKNTLNLARFRTPSHFELEYLRNGQRYPKRKTKLSPAFPPALDGKSPVNFGPLSTTFSRLMFTHEIDFFGSPYFGPKGVLLRPEIFTRVTEWPSLAHPHSTGNVGSPCNFFQRGSKIGF